MTSRTPGEKEPNLLLQKGGRGFPYLALLDRDGDVMHVVKDRSVEGFEKALGAYDDAAMRQLKKKASDDAGKAAYLQAQLEKGWIGFADARARAAKLEDVPADTKRKLESAILDREVFEIAMSARTEADREAARKRFVELFEAKRYPSGGDARGSFWALVLKSLADAGDVGRFEKGIAEARRALGDEEKAADLLQQAQEELEKQKSAKAR